MRRAWSRVTSHEPLPVAVPQFGLPVARRGGVRSGNGGRGTGHVPELRDEAGVPRECHPHTRIR